MKISVFCALVLLVLFSCVGIPEPSMKDSSLVIGSIVWDFPDGFFDDPPERLSTGLLCNFYSLSASEKFNIKTDKNYFYFECSGNDKFILQEVIYKDPEPGSNYTLKYPLKISIDSKPNAVIYVGQITVTWSSPEYTSTTEGNSVVTTYWRFRQDFKIENKIEECKEFLNKKAPGSAWSSYEVANLYEK
jgi:hypothetical protein